MGLDLDLASLQSWMQQVIVAPGSIASAVADPVASATVPVERLAEVILPAHALTPAQRLEVYQEMYPLRMEEALASDYPALKHFLGDERFLRLVVAYLQVHPSRSFTLNRLGAHMAEFLDEAREPKLTRRAMLADMARLEWAVARSFDAEESEVLTAEQAAAIPQDAWEGARLVPTPSFRLLVLAHSVDGYLETLKDEEHRHPPIRRRPTWVAVYRRNYRVFHIGLAGAAFGLLSDLANRKTLSQALAVALAREGRRPSPDQLFGWFRTWVAEGMFRKVELRSRSGDR